MHTVSITDLRQTALEDLADGLESQEAMRQQPSISIDDYMASRWGGRHAGSSRTPSSKRS